MRNEDHRSGIRLVWCAENLRERDWFKFLLGDLPIVEEVFCQAGAVPTAGPNTIYIVNTNVMGPSGLVKRLGPNLPANRPTGLIHLADEWFDGDYDAYRHFDFVVRTHHSRRFLCPGILVVPLGWPNGGLDRHPIIRASERQFNWCFLGNPVASRPAMIRAFRNWAPGILRPYSPSTGGEPPLDNASFQEVLRDTAFCPAPMGNVMIETWRLYEALEAGAIPIVERRPTLDYYRLLFGRHPIPTFTSWSRASRFARDLRKRPSALDELQREVRSWWLSHRNILRQESGKFVRRGLEGEFSAALSRWPAFAPGTRRLWQYTELLRHHSSEALLRRALLTVKRGGLVSEKRRRQADS
jgi:hypothetical protein